MRPLFPAPPEQAHLPLIVYGDALRGAPLGWIFQDAKPVTGQIQGRLWRMPSGALLLALDGPTRWIEGEIHAAPTARQRMLLASLLDGEDLGLSLLPTRARAEHRAVRVQTWAAPAAALRRQRAHALGTGRWRRLR